MLRRGTQTHRDELQEKTAVACELQYLTSTTNIKLMFLSECVCVCCYKTLEGASEEFETHGGNSWSIFSHA